MEKSKIHNLKYKQIKTNYLNKVGILCVLARGALFSSCVPISSMHFPSSVHSLFIHHPLSSVHKVLKQPALFRAGKNEHFGFFLLNMIYVDLFKNRDPLNAGHRNLHVQPQIIQSAGPTSCILVQTAPK